MVKRNRRNTRHRKNRRKTRATTRRNRKTQKGGNYLFQYTPPRLAAGILEQIDMPPRVMSEFLIDKIQKEADSA